MKDLFLYDLETTDANIQTAKIVSLGYMVIGQDYYVKQSGEGLFNPETSISPEASKVHGIKDVDVGDKPTFRTMAPYLKNLLKDCVAVGGYNNKNFDDLILEREMSEAGHPINLLEKQSVDVLELWKRVEGRTLSDAHLRWVGEPLLDAHDALSDVIGTFKVLEKIALRHPFSFAEANAFICPDAVDRQGKLKKLETGELSLTFGKHSGKPLSKVPKSYLSWILDNDFPTDTKTIIKKEADL